MFINLTIVFQVLLLNHCFSIPCYRCASETGLNNLGTMHMKSRGGRFTKCNHLTWLSLIMNLQFVIESNQQQPLLHNILCNFIYDHWWCCSCLRKRKGKKKSRLRHLLTTNKPMWMAKTDPCFYAFVLEREGRKAPTLSIWVTGNDSQMLIVGYMQLDLMRKSCKFAVKWQFFTFFLRMLTLPIIFEPILCPFEYRSVLLLCVLLLCVLALYCVFVILPRCVILNGCDNIAESLATVVMGRRTIFDMLTMIQYINKSCQYRNKYTVWT